MMNSILDGFSLFFSSILLLHSMEVKGKATHKMDQLNLLILMILNFY